MGRRIRGSGTLSTAVLCGPCPSATSPSPGGHSKDSGHDEYALMRAAICALSPSPKTSRALFFFPHLLSDKSSQRKVNCRLEERWKKKEKNYRNPHTLTGWAELEQSDVSRGLRGQATDVLRQRRAPPCELWFSLSWWMGGSALYLRSRFQEKPRRTLGSSLIASWAPWKERERQRERERERERRQHFNTTYYSNWPHNKTTLLIKSMDVIISVVFSVVVVFFFQTHWGQRFYSQIFEEKQISWFNIRVFCGD